MKKIIIATLLFVLAFSIYPSTANACDKVIKNPKSAKNAKHTVKK